MIIFLYFIAFLFPIHSAGLMMAKIIKGSNSLIPLILLSLAFFTVTFTIIPTESYDLYRHHDRIELFIDLPLFLSLALAEPGYELFHAFAWAINYLGMPIQYFSAIIVFISYFLLFEIYLDFKKNWLVRERNIVVTGVLLVFLFSIGYISIASGIRNGFANVIVFYVGYWFIYHKKILLFFIGCILAFLIHPFSIVPLILIVFAKLISGYEINFKLFFYIGIIFVFIPQLAFEIVDFINSFVEKIYFYRGSYLDPDGEWGGGFIETRSIYGIVVAYGIKRLPFYVAVLYLLIDNHKRNNPIYIILCMLYLVICIYFYFYVFSDRTILIFIYFFSAYISISFIKNKTLFNLYFFIGYFFALSIQSIFFIYEHSNFIFSSSDWLYKPLPLILLGA